MMKRILRPRVIGLGLIVAIILGIMLFPIGKLGAPRTAEHEELLRFLPVPSDESTEEAEGLARLEAQWYDRVTYPTGKFNPAWVRQAAVQDAQIDRVDPKPTGKGTESQNSPLGLSPDQFTALGPTPLRMTGCSGCFNYTTTQGRVNAIVVDPTTTTNGSIVAYAGAVGGGVWKTTNCCTSSTSWTVVTDDPLISTTAIDTLDIDPNNHNVVYAGTGDLNYGSFSMGSQGVLKSTDAGATWTLLGADVFGPGLPQPAGQFPQYQAIGKVRVDPNTSSNVLAGTKTGLYLSYDGGTNWTGPCLTNSFTTQRQDITALELSDMGATTRIIAAVGVRGFATTVQYNLGNNGANGLYSATLPASGCPSFTSIASNANGFVFGTSVTGSAYTTGANMNAGSGTAYVSTSSGNQLGRIDIAVAPSDPNVIYAQVQSIAPNNNGGCGNANGCQLGVWVTTNGGTSWSFMAGSAGGSLRNCTSGQGDYPQNWYDQALAVDPNNPDRVFISTFEVWFATRTGTSFNDVTCGYSYSGSAGPVHVDQHALAFIPGSSTILLAGHDGGINVTTNANTATSTVDPSWVNLNNNGLNTIEFYSGDISGNFNTSANPQANGGAQDNGSMSITFSGSPTGPVQWQMGKGGDGFYARIDPVGTGSSLRYWQGNNSGTLNRCTSNCSASGASWSTRTGGWTSDTQSFILPYDLFHGGIPGGDDCGPAGATTGCGNLVAGSTRVWETITGAASAVTWYVTNNPSTQNMTKQTLGNRSFINQVKYSPKFKSVAIVGTNDANVWIGRNLGTGTASQALWTNVTGGNTVLPNRPVLGIALDPSVPAANVPIGYAAIGGFDANTPATPGHVFRVDCTANCATFTWSNKTGNLPDIPVDSIIVNPRFPQQVFAGTDWGLYFTDDVNVSSPIWYRFTAGLPSAMIWDMQIDRGSTTLSLWTRGRGAYVWPLRDEAINKLEQTITFDPLANKTFGDPDFNVSATASSGLPVSFSASGNCTVSGNTVHITGAGSCTITASQPGNAMYLAADDVPQSFDIDKANQTINFPTIPDKTFADPPFNVNATASSGLPVSYAAAGSCTVSGNTVTLTSIGSCTITASQPGDDNYNPAPDVERSFNIAPAPTTTSVAANPASVQYSDPITLAALISPPSANGDTATGTVEFFINGTSVGSAAIDGSGAASLLVAGTYAPNNYNVTASFTSSNPNFANSSGGPSTLTTTREDARAYYSGNSLFWTSSVNSNNANVTLSATVRDITIVDPSQSPPNPDTYAGDIRNATVTFVDRDNGNAPLAGCVNLPVGLVNLGDFTTGSASCTTTLSVSNNTGATQYSIGIRVNNYYVRDSGEDDTIVTIAQPIPSNFITGGGFLALTNSAGMMPGNPGSKANFGFNVKYNKQGTNLQGNVNIMFRSGARVFKIKATALDSLGVNGTRANFTTKVNVKDVTDPNNPITVLSNARLQLWMTDNGEPGGSDTIGMQILGRDGGIWFSSNWDGIRTVEQVLGGGNLSVH